MPSGAKLVRSDFYDKGSMRSLDNMMSNSCNRIGNARFTLLVSMAAFGLGVSAFGGCAVEGSNDDSADVLAAESDLFLSTTDSDEPLQTPPLAPLIPSVVWLHCGGANRASWGADDRYTHFELQRRPAGGGTWSQFEIAYATSWWFVVPESSELRVRACNTFGCSTYSEVGGVAYYTSCV